MPKLYFEMQIVDEYGTVHGRLRREIDRSAAFIGTRPVEQMKMGAELGVATMPLSAVVEMMQVRELRKKLLTSAACQCGTALAEHLEDREGWHGLDRQERVNAAYPEPYR